MMKKEYITLLHSFFLGYIHHKTSFYLIVKCLIQSSVPLSVHKPQFYEYLPLACLHPFLPSAPSLTESVFYAVDVTSDNDFRNTDTMSDCFFREHTRGDKSLTLVTAMQFL